METFQILSDQFNHFQHLFHRWLAIFFIISSYIFDLSSSPHTWGIRASPSHAIKKQRFIPTYVGHTTSCATRPRHTTVHPHIRGAYLTGWAGAIVPAGSSPHTWGIHQKVQEDAAWRRFIPTYVGHTGYCGPIVSPRAGSSPHTWGIRGRNRRMQTR